MCRALAHRGPDDEGIIVRPNWAFGHRRLSIIDLSVNARQPFVNEDGSCFLTSNGEIYNYRELRPPLVKAGHRFVSASDCEVVLHLIEEEGEAGFLKLNGMYAFAYLDERRRKVLLCRDRVGIKPLYFRRMPDTILFASEIKALVCAPVVLDRSNLAEFFQYRYLCGENTFFQGIQEVLPGHVVSIDLGTLSIEDREYWVPRGRVSFGGPVDEKELSREIEQAVSRQLVSDVPVGCQLSGGLDSSLVTQIAVNQLNQGMHTFSVGFEGHVEDESLWACKVSKELGTIHHAIQYQERDFVNDIAICSWLNDDPLNHPNSMAMFKMCQEAKRYVTVMMTGEGADELFGGYTWHKRLWRLQQLGRLVHWPLTRNMMGFLPRERWAPMLPLLGVPVQEMAVRACQWISDEGIRELLLGKESPLSFGEVGSSGGQYRRQCVKYEQGPVAASMDLDMRTYLVSVLQRQDRMSMACGIESRVPFLDHELVDFALKIPLNQLFAGKRGKVILRHVAVGRISDSIINRPKLGFSVPLAAWMRQGRALGNLLGWLYDERAAERRIVDVDRVRQLVADHWSGKADHASTLWPLISFEVWARIWLDGTPHEQLKEEISQKTDHRPQTIDHRPKTTDHRQKTEDREVGREEYFSKSDVDGLRSMVSPPPLRVCHIVTSLRIGGLERMVCDLMGGLKAHGIESVLCSTDEAGELFDGAPATAKFCGHRESRLFVIDWTLVFKILRFIRANHVTLIHAHNHAPHLYGAILSFITGLPVVATRHGQGYHDKPRVRLLKRFLAGKTSTIVLVSEDSKRVSLDNHSLSKRDSIVVIPNGINITVFAPVGSEHRDHRPETIDSRPEEKAASIRLRLGIPAGAVVIGSVGRLSPEKNYPLMVRAFARLAQKQTLCATGASAFGGDLGEKTIDQGEKTIDHRPQTIDQNSRGASLRSDVYGLRSMVSSPPPFLLLVGDGPDRARIEAEIDRLNLRGQCYITGIQKEVVPWLQTMDIFCLSSDTEGLSISLLEAGACGLPSVVTDAGGNREIVKDGVSGLVVPMRDEPALAAGFERLAGDAALRRTMGAAARRIVEERFSLEAMVDGYVKVYEKVGK